VHGNRVGSVKIVGLGEIYGRGSGHSGIRWQVICIKRGVRIVSGYGVNRLYSVFFKKHAKYTNDGGQFQLNRWHNKNNMAIK